ncbi:rod shape-determining protein MreC [Myroides ceti]|uniref:Cell shape-determining protein MreC n=1 Tax=Paenimyroides ceti TaxID=395087 RepID=A0ABT8D0N2_9FLAO|nr:rod shape-determining protein MreC [Paenimyroides ceti]MDN3707853.1 rod shape-determining protein MreC [Paenimyroides ceti]MDN3709506.1 rod shape-determining protein MreC [Paenimyroides ceti]
MQQIIYFITKNSTKLLFLLLLVISLYLTVQSHAYHRSKFLHSANFVSGSIYEKTNSIKEYLHLKKENTALAEENAYLKQILYNNQIIIDSAFTINPNVRIANGYKVFQSKIIKNSYSKKENYLTIRAGSKNGVSKDMGVLNSLGIIGIVEKVSENFATVQSILNTKTKIDAKISNTNHFGTITWDGKNAGYVQLIDIPKLAKLHKGDSIVTGGESTIFPENIPIGVVDKVFTSKSSNFYTINVRLFNDMTNLQSIYIIENVNYDEIKKLEEETEH